MNATDFIKQHGVEKARRVVDKNHECYMPEVFKYWSEQLQDYVLAPKYASFLVSDLKRLIESFDLVEHFGNDIGGAKQLLEFSKGCKTIELSGSVITIDRLEQAIADYESIYSNDMGDDSHIENHVSPNCKKFEEQVGNNETK